jgi:PAS domain S-box-containing protein
MLLVGQNGIPEVFEMKYSADQLRDFINSSPILAWSCSSDGSADFFNQRWLDYTGLSAEQARDWGWTAALHSDDLNGLVDYWRSVLASGEPGEIEGRLRRFDGVYRWFLFRATPSFDNDGRVVEWFGTNTDIEDRKRAECLLAGENLVLEMTAKGNSLESILEALCRVVEQTASGCCCSVLLFDSSGSKIQQAVAPRACYQLFHCIGKDLRPPADLARFGKILGWNEKPIQVMLVTLNGRWSPLI